MSVLRSSWRLASAARSGLRAAPALSVTVRHGGGGPKPASNLYEPNGFLFNEKVSALGLYKSCIYIVCRDILKANFVQMQAL